MADYHDTLSGDLLDDFRLHLGSKNRSPSTITNYTNAARNLDDWLRADGHSGHIGDIAPEDIQRYIVAQLQTRSASTAATRFRCLQQVFRWLDDIGRIRTPSGDQSPNPMAGLEPPRLTDKPVDLVSKDDLEKLLRTATGSGFESTRDRAILRLFVDSGVRLKELTGMSLPDWDREHNVIRVHGKGGIDRDVPLGRNAANELASYRRAREDFLDARRRKTAAPEWVNTPMLWLGPKGPLSSSGIAQVVGRRGEQAGIEGLHPHRLRHTSVHLWLASGGSEGDAMSIFGWNSRQMLQRYGSAAKAERARDAHRIHSPGDQIG